MFFGCIALKFVPTNTHKCRARPEIINLTVMSVYFILTVLNKRKQW